MRRLLARDGDRSGGTAGAGQSPRTVMLVLALAASACGKDAVVGGSCRQGLTECGLQCVDIAQDRANCGACGHACAPGQACSAGACGSGGGTDAAGDGTGADANDDDVSRDASFTDRSVLDATPSDVSADINVVDLGTPDVPAADTSRIDIASGDGLVSDANQDNGSVPDGTVGDVRTPDGPTCMPPYDTPEHCGDCDTKCVDPTPLCGLQGTYKCVARCDPPLVACGSICINTSSDEKNCGTCGFNCVSGICQAGGCVGKGYGHQVVIGTDYSDPALLDSSAQVTMLGNAVFQSVAAAVRVLAYDEFAEPATVTRIESWLSTMAASRGKTVTIAKAPTWTSIPQQLTVQQYQAFLVYDQALAPANQMATTGTLWNAAMNAFAKGGGIIVALDGGSAGQMKDLLTNGGLLPVDGETNVNGTQLNVDAPTDVVGQNLPNVFAARKNTVAFTTTQMRDNYHVFVVTDATGMLPVVVHSVPRP